MIHKNYRTPREKISLILKKGELFTTSLFLIRYLKNTKQFNRYRVIISKKINTKAVKRNQLRRQVYEILRTRQELEGLENGKDMILIPKKRILEATFNDIKKDLWTNSTAS